MAKFGKLFRTAVFKLSLAYFIIVGLGFTLVLAHVGENVKQLIDEQIAQTIEADIKGLSDQYAEGGLRQLVDVVDRRLRDPGASIYLIATSAGQPLVGNVAVLPQGVLDRPAAVETSYQRVGETVAKRRAIARIFVLPGGFRVLIGHDLEDRERLARILGGALFTSLFWLLAIGALGSLLVARRVLKRVDAMSEKAASLAQGDLEGRLPLSGAGDELDRLAQNLNAMLDRIARLMAGMKEVSDNIAHDLRTPLTRLRNNAEAALAASASPQDYRGALEKTIEEADGLIRIFNALLLIARAEAGASRENMIEFDAADVVRDLGELYEPAAEERGLEFVVDASQSAMVRGNRELLGQALANLIDNALKYGAPPSGSNETARMEISARRNDGMIDIVAADHGPGVSAADRARVVERFVRLESARSASGSGLGLSLAAAVARLHGGQLRLEDNAPGLRVVLSLPAAKAQPEKARTAES